MNLSCLIIDDEDLAREGIRMMLSKCSEYNVNILAEGSNVSEAASLIEIHNPDFIFLDINMPFKSGFELFDLVPENRMPYIIFVTAYSEYALKGYSVNALDYLVKPIQQARLSESLKRVRERLVERNANNQSIALNYLLRKDNATIESVKKILRSKQSSKIQTLKINDHKGHYRVDFEDIIAIQSARDYMCITTMTGTYIHRSTLINLKKSLNIGDFFQVHRSSIVNANHVNKIMSIGQSRYNLFLSNNNLIVSSKGYRRTIKDILRFL